MQLNDLAANSYITECSEDEEGNVILEIPDELLTALGWGEGTELEIDVVGDRIVLQQVSPAATEQSDDAG
jgi:bifunctional DNA-binding transcriptional regulator/antitoxin component of YhaV-PrlF toxin-antitoxin module